MTSDLARDIGLPKLGRIQQGYQADLVVFDPATVGRGPQEAVGDVPGGGFRFIRRSIGIDKTIVNGEVLFDAGSYTDARSGRIV
jgi:N-acyl-D-aspartate/D-glutamate deacylase